MFGVYHLVLSLRAKWLGAVAGQQIRRDQQYVWGRLGVVNHGVVTGQRVRHDQRGRDQRELRVMV